jgi:hypothetical protein
MSNYPYVPESKTEIYYPRSKRRVVIDHTGKVLSDSAKEKDKDSNG